MTQPKNILFIMCDQLRWDYLSCYGHPHLDTPNIDWLASKGVKFNRAYAQSAVCGPSRMSFYTGRYVRSHGANWNEFPLRVGEMTLGDYLRPLGLDSILIGKTHMRADKQGLERYQIEEDSVVGQRLAQCGFDVFERHDGLHPDTDYDPDPQYNTYLKSKGYTEPNPWHSRANSAQSPDGNLQSGWFMKNANQPANIKEEDSETPYLTRRFMDFINQRDSDAPWMVHLSYIKPHWPYIVPEPYHDMYGPDSWLPPVRSEGEKDHPHPVYREFMNLRAGKAFSRDEVRETVLSAYMGLVKQIDDQIGLLWRFLENENLFDNTMIVFTSDHGDYLGDHWLGEKDMLHEPSVRIPLIVYDPSPQADTSRGTESERLIEAIDLAPTFVEYAGGVAEYNRLEGRSLLPILRNEPPAEWREYAISEYDYSMLPLRTALGTGPSDSTLVMVVTDRWKYIYAEKFRPMLFDLKNDPNELVDLGENPDYAQVRDTCREALFAWSREQHQRTTVSDKAIQSATPRRALEKGLYIGYWDESEINE